MFKTKAIGMAAAALMLGAASIPSFSAPAFADPDPEKKVWVCHLDSSEKYELIYVSTSSWDKSHSDHEGDFLASEDYNCSDGQPGQ
jgi:hypothetical protein